MRLISTFKKYTSSVFYMNPRIFVGIAVVVLIGVIGLLAFSGSSIISDVSNDGIEFIPSKTPEVLPIQVELERFTILEVSEKMATLDLKFKFTNPNQKSLLLHLIEYKVHHDGQRIAAGEIGSRPQGMVDGSNYFIITSSMPNKIGEKFIIKNEGKTPELWKALENNELEWTISGQAFYNLSSITAGGEKTVSFEFSK